MAKIQKLIINNFRNIVHQELDFTKKTSIIAGKNELGKSNTLNALMYMLTNTLLTDKWGSGENDIDSIIPKGAVRGIEPEVTIVTDDGTTYTKIYYTKYHKVTGKVIGHGTRYLINGTEIKEQAETTFKDSLYEKLGFRPSIKTTEIKEVNLFIDPLYALQKLEAKQLRRLLIELGCSVSNAELYELGYSDMQEYETKYLGRWDNMRKDLKSKSQNYQKRLEELNILIVSKHDCEFKQEELDSLNSLKNRKIAELERIKADNTNADEVELEKKKEVIKAEIDTITKQIDIARANFEKNKQLELNNLKAKLELKHKADCEEFQTQANEVYRIIEPKESKAESLTKQIEATETLLDSKHQLDRQITKQKSDLAVRLEEVVNKQFKKIVCPVCGTEIVEDDEAYKEFEAEKKQLIDSLESQIDVCSINQDNYKKEIEVVKAKLDKLIKEKEENGKELAAYNEQYLSLQHTLESIPYDKDFQDQIKKVEESKYNAPDISYKEAEIFKIETELKALKDKDDAETLKKIIAIQDDIKELDEKIGGLYILRSKAQEKEELLKEQQDVVKCLNNTEALLGRLNKMIATMIRLINQRATEKTGMQFVMLEENLTNDGVTEVCYATVDGVPFKDINTAKKLKYGIKFIDKLKELLGKNNLPILADRMEGIDDISKIDQLTTSQLICTRVTTAEKMEVL